jgi:hypothetical protein
MRTLTVLLPRPLGLATDIPLTASAGFLATLAIATTMYLLPALGLPQVDQPIWVARVFTSAPVGVAALGLAVHLVVGFAFAWLYTARVEPRLALSPTWAGAAYGLLLWVFAHAIAVPALGLVASTLGDGAAVSPGLLSYRLGAGAALGSLASHVSYGVVLGFVYGCHGGGQCRRTDHA